MKTGDVFRERESGHLEIVDRVKDIYKNSRGRTIAPRRVEQQFEGVPGVRRVFLAGDGRDDNVLLVVPDADDPVLAGDPQGEAARDYLRRIVAAANRDLATYERVVDFAVLPRDFSLEAGELTPKGSYRRKAIEKAFAGVIDGLYRSRVVTLAGDGREGGRPALALPRPRPPRRGPRPRGGPARRPAPRALGHARRAPRRRGDPRREPRVPLRGAEGRPRPLRPAAAPLARERRARRPPPGEGRLGDASPRLLRGGPPAAARRGARGRPRRAPGAPPVAPARGAPPPLGRGALRAARGRRSRRSRAPRRSSGRGTGGRPSCSGGGFRPSRGTPTRGSAARPTGSSSSTTRSSTPGRSSRRSSTRACRSSRRRASPRSRAPTSARSGSPPFAGASTPTARR